MQAFAGKAGTEQKLSVLVDLGIMSVDVKNARQTRPAASQAQAPPNGVDSQQAADEVLVADGNAEKVALRNELVQRFTAVLKQVFTDKFQEALQKKWHTGEAVLGWKKRRAPSVGQHRSAAQRQKVAGVTAQQLALGAPISRAPLAALNGAGAHALADRSEPDRQAARAGPNSQLAQLSQALSARVAGNGLAATAGATVLCDLAAVPSAHQPTTVARYVSGNVLRPCTSSGGCSLRCLGQSFTSVQRDPFTARRMPVAVRWLPADIRSWFVGMAVRDIE